MFALGRRSAVILCWTLSMSLHSLAFCSASSVSWRPLFGLGDPLKAVAPSLSAPVDIRGGSISPLSPKVLEAEESLSRYLDGAEKGMKFHVQGWRWHTMSVMREAERLQKLALRMAQQEDHLDLSQLQKAADYVVDFNLKALHRVEAMFYPWMRQKMGESKIASQETKVAFNTIVESLEEDQKQMAKLGQRITRSLADAASSKSNVAGIVASQSRDLADLAKSMLDREITFVMPTVGLCVPEQDQKKFNSKVIKFLGVLEARCHLVHMHEVVAEANSALEMQLWKESIPSLPRSMIPRWKRTLYEPRASMLD